MNRVRNVLAVGLLAGGSGCAALHRPPAVPPPQGPPPIAEAAAGPIDPFHPPVEPPSARIARYFPGLTRPAPSIEGVRNGGPAAKARDRALQAVPRPSRREEPEPEQETDLVPAPAPAPEAEPEITTSAAAPRRFRNPFRRFAEPASVLPTTTTPKARPVERVASAPRPPSPRAGIDAARSTEPVPEAESSPLLNAAVTAEVDPKSRPSRLTENPAGPDNFRREPAGRLASVSHSSSTALSPRRMPPLPSLDPASPRPSLAHEDRQTRQARARSEEADTEQEARPTEPLLAARSVEVAPGTLEPAAPAAEPEPEPEPVKDVAKVAASADPAPLAPAPPPVVDAPPPIEEPEAVPPAQPPRREPEAARDRILAGRPRLTQPSAERAALMADLPPVKFPRAYYGSDTAARPSPKHDAATTQTARWSWPPRLFKKLRGYETAVETVRPAK